MNIKKPVDYSKMYAVLDRILSSGIAQMDMFQEIGKLIDDRPEKGAAVAAADYISAMHPNVRGFSPRGIRRMREFYRAYKNNPALMSQAMKISWTANVVIIECCKTDYEREWYIQAVQKFGWSKQILITMIAENAHEHINLDISGDNCYTKTNHPLIEEVLSDNIQDLGAILQEVTLKQHKSLVHVSPTHCRKHIFNFGLYLPLLQFYQYIMNGIYQFFLAKHCGGLPRLAC